MISLEEQLENEKKGGGQKSPEIKIPEPPQLRYANTEAEIKAFKAKQDLESLELGYNDLKHRETTMADREKALEDSKTELTKRIGEFELEQKTRVENVNNKANEYNEQFNLLKTEREEAKKLMAEALEQKAKANSIIKSQTQEEESNQRKQEAYTSNMDEAIKLCGDMARYLKRQEDGRAFSMGNLLQKDLTLIQWIQYKKLSLKTIAELIEVDCDRITELCEYLQDSKRDYSECLKYLLDSTEWLSKKLLIEWKPNEEVIPT